MGGKTGSAFGGKGAGGRGDPGDEEHAHGDAEEEGGCAEESTAYEHLASLLAPIRAHLCGHGLPRYDITLTEPARTAGSPP